MKHVFAVTSHLTFSIAKTIVAQRRIASDDCVLFLVRGYRLSSAAQQQFKHVIETNYNVDRDKGRVFAGLNVLATRRNIRQFDDKVDIVVGTEDFVWYTPVCSNDICSLMVTKRNCCGYYVIEDGFASYRTCNPQTFTGLRYGVYLCLLRPLYPRIFAVKNHFITTNHPKFKGCIATSELCFPLHQQYLSVIGNPFERVEWDTYPDVVLSVDPLYQFVSDEYMEQIYTALAQYMMQHHAYSRMLYKFHPRFDAEENRSRRLTYESIIKRLFPTAKEMDRSVVLESLLASCGADFYSCNSSVALYAAPSGTTCYNIMPNLKGTDGYAENDVMSRLTKPLDFGFRYHD
ncbi:MAG: hypothetical protein IJV22_00795 [Bacteroidales bacterium]|nr:hypothetical protein [Bacteroidales bacterium]